MPENCNVCNSIISEITMFNGETKHFCSIECVKTEELIGAFRDFVQKKINKYQYTSKEELMMFLHPPDSKKMVNGLIGEVLRRGYFNKGVGGFIYPNNKIIRLPRDK